VKGFREMIGVKERKQIFGGIGDGMRGMGEELPFINIFLKNSNR
jgi:hypothetical protein